jgi:hypothetical protein
MPNPKRKKKTAAPPPSFICKLAQDGKWYVMQVLPDQSTRQYLGPFDTSEECQQYLP